MSKKLTALLQRITIVAFTVLFGVCLVGTIIANENASAINSALGCQSFKTITDENAENEDTEWYKSEYDNLGELIDAGAKMTEEAMKEGAVLLKNENNALPLASGSRNVSVFGITSGDPVYGGTGSGSVDTSKAVNFYDAFKAAGLTVNPTLQTNYTSKDKWYTGPNSSSWGSAGKYNPETDYRRYSSGWAGSGGVYIGGVPWNVVKTEESTFASYGDAAVFIIGRVGGEGADLKMSGAPDGYNGDFLHLTQKEMDTLEGLNALKKAGTFKKIIMIINSASMVGADFLHNNEKYGVDAALWVGALGQNGATAIAKILTGEYVPSGKLSDTFWMDHTMNPVNVNYGYWEYADAAKYGIESQKGNMFVPEPTLHAYAVYQEGMYLGYRYTETRYEDYVLGTAKVGDYDYSKVVAYPFGHGISYTDFEYSNFKVSKSGARTYNVSVTVKNTGKTYSGKETVQIYVSKPYGDYAKKNNIQVPSVELIEFGKTGVLAPGASETLTIPVDEKYFASYDAYGAGTYVIMPGDYYLTAATDAHNAVNNVLKAKGASESKMVGKATAGMTEKITLALNDQRYAFSDATGNPIGNLFDYADINRYSGKGSNSVKYYNRSDWAGTVSLDRVNGVPKLTATQQMADEILSQCPVEYKKPIAKDKEKKAYPTYGKSAGLVLVNMRYDSDGNHIEIDDPVWDTFMDQLTWDEIATLVSTGYHNTALVESIVKPETNDENGPNGFNRRYNQDKEGLATRKEIAAGNLDKDGKPIEGKTTDPNFTKKTTAFPANGIIAATFNRDLARKVGNIIGEDGIWCGCSGLYGIGANIHRSPYLGRTAEYYSECGMLTGLIAAHESLGIEEKGVHVYNKHCVVNDQENARHGVGVWVTEQALREIYLRAFELPITIGGAFNTMASFARIGTMAGPSDGVLGQSYLRGECGMKGVIVTDMYTDMNGAQDNSPYFELAYGIYTGGCDIPDGSGHESQFDAYKPNSAGEGDYADMAWAMRLAAKRICYMVANSSAMNGIGSATRIVKVMPWWQATLIAFDVIFGVLLVAGVAWTVVTVVLNLKKRNA